MDVGLLSPGHMGCAVGRRLQARGARITICVAGRSERTRALAREAGFTEAEGLMSLVDGLDVELSIVPPGDARAVASQLAEAVSRVGRSLVVADCNAIAPTTIQAIAGQLGDAGAVVVDGAIIGPPPTHDGTTRFHVSGPDTDRILALREYGLDVRYVSDRIGAASALKMSFAALTKGMTALATQLLHAAEEQQVFDTLLEEFRASTPGLLDFIQRQLPVMPMKARRFVGEMQEIERAFADAGLPHGTYAAIAAVYRWLTERPIADETPEARDRHRDARGVIAAPLEH